jgi:hypothetical protein
MTMPFEKRFLKKWSSPQISSKSQVLKSRSIEKRKEKLQESSQRKGDVNILRGEKHFNFKDPF